MSNLTRRQSRLMERTRAFFSSTCATVLLVAAGTWLGGCGDDDAAGVEVVEAPGDDVGFRGDNTSVVVVGDNTYVVTGDPGNECVEIEGQCIDVGDGQHCGDNAQVDVVVVDGEVVDVICYPEPEGTSIEEVERDADGNGEVPQDANGTVVVFDPATDGEPIDGDIDMQGERIAIVGNGVDETIIDGNVHFQSNNSRVRGVTITGNLTYGINSNNSAASFCKVYGNLEVDSNEFVGSNCIVFGNVRVSGNGATLVNIGVGGEWDVNASALCDGCYSFDDADGDFDVTEEEEGEALTCGGGGGRP